MSTLYLLKPELKVCKDGGRFIVEEKGLKVQEIPMKELESVIVYKAQLTTQVIEALLELGANVIYIDKFGKVIGVLGKNDISAHRLLQQIDKFYQENQKVTLSRYCVEQKIGKQIEILKKYNKKKSDYELAKIIKQLERYQASLLNCAAVEAIRGIEGIATKDYFRAFEFIVNSKEWLWQGRNRRPPKDPINAMLSLGYTMLEKEIRIGLLVAKLDCRFGFFHSNNGRKDSLVFDMMDLFRQDIIDRMVITFINKKMFTQDDFHYFDNACFFTESGRKKFFLRYEEFIVLKKAGEISKREKIIQAIKDFAKDIMKKQENDLGA